MYVQTIIIPYCNTLHSFAFFSVYTSVLDCFCQKTLRFRCLQRVILDICRKRIHDGVHIIKFHLAKYVIIAHYKSSVR